MLGPLFVLHQVDCFARGNDNQETPQVMAVVELRKPAVGGRATKAVQGTECYVLLIGGTAGRTLEPGARQGHQTLEVVLPQGLGGRQVACLQLLEPMADW